MKNKKKVAVVTGGAGFIGSHMVDLLLKKNFYVNVIDDLSGGSLNNLKQHFKNKNFNFEKKDLCKLNPNHKFFAACDYVFHFAGKGDIVPSIENPIKYLDTNIMGTTRVLEAAKKAYVKKFVYSASSSCYGIPDEYPTKETAEIRPQYPYALTKILGEQLVMHWCQLYNLPAVSLRFFNVYGPRARTSGTYGAVFGVFLAQKLAQKPYTVVGDGSQTRDFTYVSDVVSAIVSAAKSDVSGEVINIGSNNTYSINQLVDLLDGDVIHIPKRPGEPNCTWADISKANQLLNWNPKVSLEDGVEILLDNMDYWSDAPIWDEKSIAKETEKWFEYLS